MADPSIVQDPAPKQGAVFVSYAREDAQAARRIADALRGFGVEVWFDQSELRGGDAWDAMIRTQVRTCALFLPIISAVTQARGEGYFRREWKLAVERTHDMAEHIPFILPVAIGDTPESAAFVPDQFRRVQWIRLVDGAPTPQFVDQVKRLLSGPGLAIGPAAPRKAAWGSGTSERTRRSPPNAMVALAAVAIGTALFFALRPVAKEAPVTAQQESPTAPRIDSKSIAVLPFDNMSEDKENNAFFADGIHEDILTNLALIPELRVVSRTSVMQYRSTIKPIRQIGQELGVAYILEGSVRRSGNKVRVTGQLIRAASDEHIWAKAYDRDLTDVFAIQGELAQEIASALQAAISPETKKLIERKPTDNVAAYDLWLKARQLWNDGAHTPPILKKQIELLQGAVDIDPGFAQAWGDLAVAHAQYTFWNYDHTDARLAMAKAAIDNAVRLAPDVPDVIRDLGSYYYYGYRDYTRALEQYQRLAQLRPNDAALFTFLGAIKRRQGDWAGSIANSRKSVELDPANGIYRGILIESLTRVRRYAEAAEESKRRLAQVPKDLDTAFDVASVDFSIDGSTAGGNRFLANLSPEIANSPRGISLRRYWARSKGDFEEAIRLDKLQPFFDEDGSPHYRQALLAALDRMAQDGDRAALRESIPPYATELRSRLGLDPENGQYLDVLAVMEAILGNSEEALRLSHKSMQLVPESRDQLAGPTHSTYYAVALAWNGDKDQSINELRRLLHIPTGGILEVHDLLHSVWFIPLHDDPRFVSLCKDPSNAAPLF